jgi:hypothetical protein
MGRLGTTERPERTHRLTGLYNQLGSDVTVAGTETVRDAAGTPILRVSSATPFSGELPSAIREAFSCPQPVGSPALRKGGEIMKTPGFHAAEASLYKKSGRYQATTCGIAPTTTLVAQDSPWAMLDSCPSFERCLDAYKGCYLYGHSSACLTYYICRDCGVIVA